MPEGPECRRIASRLSYHLHQSEITNIEVLSGRYLKKPIEDLDTFTRQLPIKVMGVGTKGKFIFIALEDCRSLWTTMGMAGFWTEDATKFSRIRMDYTGPKSGSLYFNDARNFGTFKIAQSGEELDAKLATLGPDLLTDDISYEEFKSRINLRPTWPICKVLMDQSIVSGIGNYLKAEILWLTKISPHRLVSNVQEVEMQDLYQMSIATINCAYENFGSTVKVLDESIVSLIGDRHRLVYGYATDIIGNNICCEQTEDGRVTHWVRGYQT